ncbi:hypothetical protein, partial [Ligaoa zhengdingensis]
MKKILAIGLALALIFGMVTVAFAVSEEEYDQYGVLKIGTLMTYQERTRELQEWPSRLGEDLPANATYAFVIYDGETGQPVTDFTWLTEHYKVRTLIDEGAGFISAKPQLKLIEVADPVAPTEVQTMAAIVFSTADKFQMERVDYEMQISIYPDEKGEFGFVDDGNLDQNGVYHIELEGEIGYGETWVKVFTSVYRDAPIVVFNEAQEDLGEVELYFDSDYNWEITIIANGHLQKSLFLRLNEEVPQELEELYPAASLRAVFFDGHNKAFRKQIQMKIPAAPIEIDGELRAPYIYRYEDGEIVATVDAQYDFETQELIIKTHEPGDYIISDRKMVVTPPSKPSTGGNGSSSSKEDSTQEYWAEIKEKINGAEAGDTIYAKLEDGAMIPATVIDALKGKDINLVVTCQGHDYRLNGSSLPGYNAAAVYYTASEMIAMAGSAPI